MGFGIGLQMTHRRHSQGGHHGRHSGTGGWGRLRKLPSSGRWHASYVHGITRYNAPGTFAVKMDGEAWLAAERKLIDQDIWTSPKVRAAQRTAKAITLTEYAEKWIEQRNIKPTTRTEYKRLLAGPIGRLGKVALRDISSETVRAWYSSLGTETPRRASHAYGLLHAVLTTAVADEVIPSNPCTITGVMNPARKREPVILSVAEVAKVADAIRPERLRCLVLISAWCGLRWGEVIELRRRDIADNGEVIIVSRGATHRGACRIDTTKSGRARAVVVPPHIRADLKHHLDVYVGKEPDALVFPALRDGCHLNDSVFAKHFAPALKTVGREGVRIHDLRHFAGSQTARVGNLRETMDRLGHSTVTASMRYQAMVSGRDREVAAGLSALAAAEVAEESKDTS